MIPQLAARSSACAQVLDGEVVARGHRRTRSPSSISPVVTAKLPSLRGTSSRNAAALLLVPENKVVSRGRRGTRGQRSEGAGIKAPLASGGAVDVGLL